MRSLHKKIALAAIACLVLGLLTPVASAVSLLPSGDAGEASALSPLIEQLSLLLKAENLGTSVTPLILALALIGILLAFFGYPLLRMTVFLGGFGTGIAVASLLLSNERVASALTSPWMPLVVMLILGAVFAWLFCKLFALALFFTGFGATILVGMGPIRAMLPNPLVGILAVIAVALVLGLLATRFVRPIIVLTTAAAGGSLFSLALSGLIPVPYIKLVLFAVLFFLGLAVQLRTRAHLPAMD